MFVGLFAEFCCQRSDPIARKRKPRRDPTSRLGLPSFLFTITCPDFITRSKFSAMIKKKSTKIVWPYTPEPSPRLEPSVYPLEDVSEDFTMPSDEMPRARPISMAARKEGIMSPGGRPTLEDVLKNRAPPPYTLAAYTAFLSQQHCLETLEFTTEAKKYGEKYDEASANLAGMPLTIDTDEGHDLIQDWSRILDIYIKPGAPREINLPAEERDALVRRRFDLRPPLPETLDAAVKRMYDLMSDSIFIPFCNSVKTMQYPQTYHVMSDFGNLGDLEASRTFDERAMHRRNPSKRHKSPPNSSTSAATFEPSRSPPPSHRPTQSSSLTSALGRQSGVRLSTHVSHSSAMSEGALTDSSAGPESPPIGEHDAITPPTTPPTSDLSMGGTSHSSGGASVHQVTKTQRSESSGGWKKAIKFLGGGGKKKNGGYNNE